MADVKATSFRVNEEDIVKFKEFADKEGYNQAEAFKSIMQTVEMAKAKNMIKDRAKEIEVFQDTINNLMSMFLNSLNVNQTSEERIREELSQELQTKDNTIATMYDQLQEVKADNKDLKDNNKELNDNIKAINEEVKKLNNDILDKNKNIDKLNSNNDLLQENLKEYKEYKDNYKNLENELEQLKADHDVLKDINNKLNNDNKQLNDKIKNDSDMIEFYKNNIAELKGNIDTYKADIKMLESKYNQELNNIKAENTKALQEQLKKNELEFKERLDFELQKKQLEMDKLKNELEHSKKSSARVSAPKTK